MQLFPYFQPIVDIATAQIVGHEVLARTVDGNGQVRSAGALFCDPSQDEQRILAYDRSVRSQALQSFAEAGQPGFLTLNISPRWIDLLNNECIPTVEMLQEYKVAPEKIVIEIVETQSNPEKLESIVKRYKSLGMRVAVDDFGAGYSQFDRVIRLEPDIVKLDMRLFKQAMQGGFPRHIVQSLSYLAERMGSQVLCEGVEHYQELRFALEIGSKLIQGFMFSEAQNTFVEAEAFQRDIAVQRRRFLFEGIGREQKAMEDSRRIQDQVEALCEQISSHGKFVDLDFVDKNHIVSLFICDAGGTQISPTYRLDSANEWQSYINNIGNNWCWRPYFYQLLSSVEPARQESVTSKPYHDAVTGALVRTIARFVNDTTVLMVDIKHRGIFTH